MSYQPNKEEEEEKTRKVTSAMIAIYVFMLIWIVSGFVAFIMSLYCFGRQGTITEKIIGLLLAIAFGPFYFIYYMSSKTYCARVGAPLTV